MGRGDRVRISAPPPPTSETMTDSLNPALQILPTPKKRASYRPAALRTNSNSRASTLAGHDASSPTRTATTMTTATTPNSPLYHPDSRLCSRRSSGGLSASSSSPLAADAVTRDHWTPDASVSSCGACPTSFSLLERRHHCRRCGGIFCAAHSRYTVTLNASAEFSPTGLRGRACPRCRREFELWMNPPNIKRPETSSSGTVGATGGVRPQRMGRTYRAGAASGGGQADEAEEEGRGAGMPAASVPSDWTWSTF